MINKVVIEGRLMKEVEFRTLPSGKQYARIVLELVSDLMFFYIFLLTNLYFYFIILL